MFKVLHQNKALSEGSDLWVIIFNPENFWFQKINWLSKFTLQKEEDFKQISEPLLVATQQFLPNKSILCMPKNTENLSEKIHTFWKNLKKPSLRVFIDSKDAKEEFESKWPKEDLQGQLSCVIGNK